MDVTKAYKFIGFGAWKCLKLFIFLVLGPPLPRGVPGEGPDCHFPREIVGVGPIPARIRVFLISMLALSTARNLLNVKN